MFIHIHAAKINNKFKKQKQNKDFISKKIKKAQKKMITESKYICYQKITKKAQTGTNQLIINNINKTI